MQMYVLGEMKVCRVPCIGREGYGGGGGGGGGGRGGWGGGGGEGERTGR